MTTYTLVSFVKLEWKFNAPIFLSTDWLKKEKEPEMALCAPPLYDKTYAYGLTGDKRGLVTSVNESDNGDGNTPTATLLAIANLGGFLFNLSFVNDLKHCEQHKYSPFLVNLALGESKNQWSSGLRTV